MLYFYYSIRPSLGNPSIVTILIAYKPFTCFAIYIYKHQAKILHQAAMWYATFLHPYDDLK